MAPEHLLEMKSHTLTALAEYMGKDLDDDMSQLEVQVCVWGGAGSLGLFGDDRNGQLTRRAEGEYSLSVDPFCMWCILLPRGP